MRDPPMPLQWYYMFSPVRFVEISEQRLVFIIGLWSHTRDTYEQWDLRSFPVRKDIYLTTANVRSLVVTDSKRLTLFIPDQCRGTTQRLCVVERFERRACELGIISGAPDACRLTITAANGPLAVMPYQVNEWVLAPRHVSSAVTLQCDGRRHRQFVVNATELWWVHPRCNIATDNITTNGVRSYKHDVSVKYEPPIIVNFSFVVPPEVASEIPVLLPFHPRLEVTGLSNDLLDPVDFSDAGMVTGNGWMGLSPTGLSIIGILITLIITIIVVCIVYKRCRPMSPKKRSGSPIEAIE